ncbi:hypothetical protein BK344_23330 [Escherichia coli]|nr:hypothetical protein BK344_23330 [Escherichia coli]OJP62610.1 hypothetical protein BK345_23330 [Escherichia coli]
MGNIRIIKAISSVVKPPSGGFLCMQFTPCAYPVLTGCNELQSSAWQCRIERVASSIENQAALPVFRYASGKGAAEQAVML